ncbi:MAG: 4Fe-4S dicluster domain-containing protein, partial [Chloroflexi bacterium]|nr:4Fe-4S dicluster domain-containing protein [Chloroflexota bacterium]
SEGTLGFIAEAVLHTLPEFAHKYTGQLYFRNVRDAAAAIHPLRLSGARAAEIMDRASLRSVQDLPGAPAELRQLPGEAAAILVEYQAEDRESILQFQREADRVIRDLRLLHDVAFTDDPAAQAALWKLRKGIIPSVGAMRPPATTLLTEDIVFPVPLLAEGVTDLQRLFAEFGYQEGVIFGHAKDGNLHFLISQSFNTGEELNRFAGFMEELVRVVSGKYDGALKAEHGTGRNTAPFVETEWGAEAYAIMRDLKSLLDPANMLNPGVVINADPQAHVAHVKSMAQVGREVDQCIECGFCESKCPSRRLTLTPRQRIVIRREISRLQFSSSDPSLLASLLDDYSYAGNDTCALDGLCATACPVGIDTGELTRRLRAESNREEGVALWIASHFSAVEKVIGFGVRLGHVVENIAGVDGVRAVSVLAEKIFHTPLPKWNGSIPFPSRAAPAFQLAGGKDFVYFPSCISRRLGVPNLPGRKPRSLQEALVIVSGRAGIHLQVPDDVVGACCGMPFASKGYVQAHQAMLRKILGRMWEWSNHGEIPIVIDTTSCVHSLRTCRDDLEEEDRRRWGELTILDAVEFLHDHVLPKLEVHPVEEKIILHPNCSGRKLGLETKMLAIAQRCAGTVSLPLNLGCCAFAGDRGLLFPELTRSATEMEAAEVLAGDYYGHYSSNIPCEIGMSQATGKDYMSIVYLVEKASR